MSRFQAAVLFSCFCFLKLTQSYAAVPGLISYQGQLNDGNGVPVNSTVSFVFSIYDVPTGGTTLWTENQTISVSNGAFNVQLGAVVTLPASIFAKDALYLGIKVGADQEMTPRQRITSSAYAQRAELGVPIGTILPWAKNTTGVPSLSDGWVECNGQVLSDPASPLNGQTIPDLNGVTGIGRFLRGSTTSGGTGGSDSHNHQWHGSVINGNNNSWRMISATGSSSGWSQSYDVNGNLNNFTTGPGIFANYYTSMADGKPPYFNVVWIMRVK